MVAMVKYSIVLALVLGVVPISASKCKWSKGDGNCRFNLLDSGVEFGGRLGDYMGFAAKSEACGAHSGAKTACEGHKDAEDANICYYNQYDSMCRYKKSHEMMSIVYGDMSGCKAHMSVTSNCNTHLSEAACTGGANCKWESQEGWSADSASHKYYHNGDGFEGCLDGKAPPGRCEPDYVKILCDKVMNETLVTKSFVATHSCPAQVKAAADPDAAKIKACLEAEGICAPLTTDAVAAILLKDERTADDELAMKTAEKACYAEHTCPEFADAVIELPHLADLPDKDCHGNADSTTCGQQSNCFWVPADESCMKTKDIREGSNGDATCIFTKMQEIEGKIFDSDQAMKDAYKQKRVDEKACEALTPDTCGSNANCQLRTHTPASCSESGAIEWGDSTQSCGFERAGNEAMEKERNDLMWGEGAVDDIVTVGDTCEALTTEADCTGAVYTDAEKGSMESAAAKSKGVADSAQLATHYPIVPLLLGAAAVGLGRS